MRNRLLFTVTAAPSDNIGSIPTISRFHGIVITMYFDDHGHPYFHARHGGREAKIRFDEIAVIDSDMEVR